MVRQLRPLPRAWASPLESVGLSACRSGAKLSRSFELSLTDPVLAKCLRSFVAPQAICGVGSKALTGQVWRFLFFRIWCRLHLWVVASVWAVGMVRAVPLALRASARGASFRHGMCVFGVSACAVPRAVGSCLDTAFTSCDVCCCTGFVFYSSQLLTL